MFQSDSRLDEEIESHIAMQAEEFARGGLPPAEARAAAARAFGHATQIREQHREQRRLPGIDTAMQDVRYAIRQWRVNPVFALTAIVTLALSIGATTSIYQLLDAIILRTLAVRAPEELVTVSGRVRFRGEDQEVGFSYPQLMEMARRQTTIAGIFATGFLTVKDLEAEGRRQAEPCLRFASRNYFALIGTTPQLGRLLNEADDAPGAPPVAAISDAFWRSEFHGRSDAVGRNLRVNGFTLRVVGVTRPEFYGERLGTAVDAWIPMGQIPAIAPTLASTNCVWLSPMARLRPGVSRQQAQAELTVLWSELGSLGIPFNGGARTVELKPASHGMQTLQTEYEKPLWLLMGTVVLLLLIGCANLANLLLARATARTHEIGVRLALGAGRARVIRQLLTESLVLSIAGGAAGIALAAVASREFLHLAMTGERWNIPTSLDWRVLGFATAVSVGAVLVFGLVPAFASTKLGLPAALRAGSRTQSSGRFPQFATRGFVVAQLTLSVLLVAGSAMLIRSFWNVAHQDFGYNVEGTLSASLQDSKDGSFDIVNPEVQLRIIDRIQQIPGVLAAGASITGLLNESVEIGGMPIATESRVIPDSAKVRMVAVTSGYQEAMAIPLVRGRALTREDRQGAARVVVVSESAARAIFGGANPIGQRVFPGRQFRLDRSYEVVGVMRDIRYATPREDFGPLIFAPVSQLPAATNPMVVLRVSGDPAKYAGELKAAIREVAPSFQIYKMRTLREAVQAHARRERLLAWLSGGFGVLALVLAAVGLYGVVAYAAQQRTAEMGIRLALGATPANVRGLLLRELIVLLGVGLAAGGAAALGLGWLLDSLLFGLSSHDPLTLGAALAALTAVALVAGYLPARRVAGIDPSAALRQES
jgi:predicted permease